MGRSSCRPLAHLSDAGPQQWYRGIEHSLDGGAPWREMGVPSARSIAPPPPPNYSASEGIKK